MKHKFLAGALAAVLSLSLGTIGAQAHCVRHWTCAHPHGECVRCTDRNQDGLCDVPRSGLWTRTETACATTAVTAGSGPAHAIPAAATAAGAAVTVVPTAIKKQAKSIGSYGADAFLSVTCFR